MQADVAEASSLRADSSNLKPTSPGERRWGRGGGVGKRMNRIKGQPPVFISIVDISVDGSGTQYLSQHVWIQVPCPELDKRENTAPLLTKADFRSF